MTCTLIWRVFSVCFSCYLISSQRGKTGEDAEEEVIKLGCGGRNEEAPGNTALSGLLEVCLTLAFGGGVPKAWPWFILASRFGLVGCW